MASRMVTRMMTLRDLRSCPNSKMAWDRYRFGYNRAPIGNGTHLGIKWSRDRWRPVRWLGQGRDPDLFGCIWKRLQTENRYPTTNGPSIRNGYDESNGHVTLWGHSHVKDVGWPIILKMAGDPDSFYIEHIHNKWHRLWLLTTRYPERSRSWPRYTWMQISRRSLEVALDTLSSLKIILFLRSWARWQQENAQLASF